MNLPDIVEALRFGDGFLNNPAGAVPAGYGLERAANIGGGDSFQRFKREWNGLFFGESA